MYRACRSGCGMVALAVALAGWPALGQEAAPGSPESAGRRLAPGVMQTIAPEIGVGDTLSRKQIAALVADPAVQWKPQFVAPTQTLQSLAEEVAYRREIWGLEFSFKPLRLLQVELPDQTGKLQPKLVWYMVYQVRNPGTTLVPTLDEEGRPKVEPSSKPVRFVPRFVLEATDLKVRYPDRILSTVIPAIERRESPPKPLLDSVAISRQPIPPSTPEEDHSLWGVVTWVDVDPRTDILAVYVFGLTNSYLWRDDQVPTAGGQARTVRRFAYKVLKLDFWRPGDEFSADESEIRYGLPRKPPYTWLYRELDGFLGSR